MHSEPKAADGKVCSILEDSDSHSQTAECPRLHGHSEALSGRIGQSNDGFVLAWVKCLSVYESLLVSVTTQRNAVQE